MKAIVVLLHEGGNQAGAYNECVGISDPILTIASNLDAEIDLVVTGHTHQPYVCNVPDPEGKPRMVTSAASYGQVLTEAHLFINKVSGQVARAKVTAANRLVTRDVAKDAGETSIIQFWNALSAPIAGRVVGTLAPDTNITGHSNTCRCEETPMADLVADAILWGTEAPENGGAQIALMNTGGVRASLLYNQITNGEAPGEITYAETYNVAPFNNILVTHDMTGAEIEAVLNQQYNPVSDRGSRPMLSLQRLRGLHLRVGLGRRTLRTHHRCDDGGLLARVDDLNGRHRRHLPCGHAQLPLGGVAISSRPSPRGPRSIGGPRTSRPRGLLHRPPLLTPPAGARARSVPTGVPEPQLQHDHDARMPAARP